MRVQACSRSLHRQAWARPRHGHCGRLLPGGIFDLGRVLNDNYKGLLGTLDEDQAAKARAMQRAWVAYRDTTCQFYDDKIQGSMAVTMHAACVARESARRAMLLKFFTRL
jgi:Lysozyme inhibitor LprI